MIFLLFFFFIKAPVKQSDISERTILQTLRENLRCTPYVMKSYKYSLRTIRPIDFINIFYSLPKSYCSKSFSAILTKKLYPRWQRKPQKWSQACSRSRGYANHVLKVVSCGGSALLPRTNSSLKKYICSWSVWVKTMRFPTIYASAHPRWYWLPKNASMLCGDSRQTMGIFNPLDYHVWNVIERGFNKSLRDNVDPPSRGINKASTELEREYFTPVGKGSRIRIKVIAIVLNKGDRQDWPI